MSAVERRWILVNRHGPQTRYWLGGNIHPSKSVMVTPVDTIFRHLAARLTEDEARDALDHQGKVLQLQGWEPMEVPE